MQKSRRWQTALTAAVLLLGGIGGIRADEGDWAAGFSLSFPEATGQTKNVLESGMGFNFNVEYRPPENLLGLRMDVWSANFLLDDVVLRHIENADGGYASIWGFGLNALLATPRESVLKPYIYGGPGVYYVRAEATRTGVGGGYICDPWWGCYPAYGPADYGVAQMTTTRLGWQAGAGLGFHFPNGGALVFDFQYILINMSYADTEFMPMNFGYKQRF